MRLAFVVLLVAACGSKTPDPQVVSNAPPDAGPRVVGPPAEGCPATWADLQSGGTCDPAVSSQSCTYAEGSCWCGTVMPCSGVAWSDEDIAQFPVAWQCTVTPPAVRADGCPGTEPNGACSQDGRVCSYGDCCVSEYTCQRGHWAITGSECPP